MLWSARKISIQREPAGSHNFVDKISVFWREISKQWSYWFRHGNNLVRCSIHRNKSLISRSSWYIIQGQPLRLIPPFYRLSRMSWIDLQTSNKTHLLFLWLADIAWCEHLLTSHWIRFCPFFPYAKSKFNNFYFFPDRDRERDRERERERERENC